MKQAEKEGEDGEEQQQPLPKRNSVFEIFTGNTQAKDSKGECTLINTDEVDVEREIEAVEEALEEDIEMIEEEVNYIRNYTTAVIMANTSASPWLNIGNLDVGWLRFVAFVEMFCWLGICTFFAYDSYTKQAMDPFPGFANTQGDCSPIRVATDVKYSVAIDDGSKSLKRGVWSAETSQFQANSSAYAFRLSDYIGSSDGLTARILDTKTALSTFDTLGQNRSLPWNLILWSSYVTRVVDEASGEGSRHSGFYEFETIGEINTIFGAQTVMASLGNKDNGLCQVAKTRGSWTSTDSSFHLHIKSYYDNSGSTDAKGTCPNSLTVANFGINNNTISDNFQDLDLKFDMRAIAIALAINMGQIEISMLIRMTSAGADGGTYAATQCSSDANCNGVRVVDWAAFYDPRSLYIGMTPIDCIGFQEGTFDVSYFCLVRVGDQYLFPSINSYEDCNDCSSVLDNNILKENCNEQDILIALIFYPDEDVTSFPKTLKAISELKTSTHISQQGIAVDTYLNKQSYSSAKFTADGVLTSSSVSSSDIANSYANVCASDSCSMIVFRTVKYNRKSINEFGLEVPYGACNSSFYHENRFTELMANQPFVLNEEFMSCVFDIFDNLVLSVGISTGNATVGTQIFMFFFTLFLGQYLRWRHNYRTNFDVGRESINSTSSCGDEGTNNGDKEKNGKKYGSVESNNGFLNSTLSDLQASSGTRFKLATYDNQNENMNDLENVIRSLQQSKDAQTCALIEIMDICKDLTKSRDNLLSQVSELTNQLQDMSKELEKVKHRHVRMTKSQGNEILNHLSSQLKGRDNATVDDMHERLANTPQQQESWRASGSH